MGTIVIEEYGAAGTPKQSDTQMVNLKTLLVTTVDSTTSTTAESITLQEGTSLIAVSSVEDHRVALASDTTATKYAKTLAGNLRWFGVEGGSTLYYRADA